MKSAFLIIVAAIFLGRATAHAHDVLVIQSLRVKPHEEALRGFTEVCKADTKRLFLSALEGVDIARTIREEPPRLIVAIGANALKKVSTVRGIPVIYLMVVVPQPPVRAGRNITGVSMDVPPEKYVDLLTRISPPLKVVGVVYDPEKTGYLVKRAQQAARVHGIALLTREVHGPREVVDAIQELKVMVDGFWMLPDTSVVTPETVQMFLLASHEVGVPIISFAGKYVDMGALAALDIDAVDQGKQAGELATKILNGVPIADLMPSEPRSTQVKVNRTVAKKLGITVNK